MVMQFRCKGMKARKVISGGPRLIDALKSSIVGGRSTRNSYSELVCGTRILEAPQLLIRLPPRASESSRAQEPRSIHIADEPSSFTARI